MATKDGSKEAFPALQSVTTFPDGGRTVAMGAPGMTLREWYAGLAMQGGMAHENSSVLTHAEIAESAVKMADALISALEPS